MVGFEPLSFMDSLASICLRDDFFPFSFIFRCNLVLSALHSFVLSQLYLPRCL